MPTPVEASEPHTPTRVVMLSNPPHYTLDTSTVRLHMLLVDRLQLAKLLRMFIVGILLPAELCIPRHSVVFAHPHAPFFFTLLILAACSKTSLPTFGLATDLLGRGFVPWHLSRVKCRGFAPRHFCTFLLAIKRRRQMGGAPPATPKGQ